MNIPVKEISEHTCGYTCRCKPVLELVNPAESNDRAWVHHAFDMANDAERDDYIIASRNE